MKTIIHSKNKRTDTVNRTLTIGYLILSLMLVMGMALAACEGPAGSQGSQGPDGQQGPEGPIGPAGEDGSMIHAGEGVPGDDVGTWGDLYLNTNTAELYGPKNESDGWGVPMVLRGADGQDGQDGTDGQDGQDGAAGQAGQDGEDGSQIYSGTSAPAASLGQEGDYYLNKTTFDLYGPKTGSGWGMPINLQATTNVMYTSWFEPDWDIDEPRYKRMRVTEFRLTTEFKESGVVLVYRRNNLSPGNIRNYLLPQTIYYVGGDVSRVYRSYISGNGVYIEIRSYTQDLDAEDYDAPHNAFRYVLIPGSEDISAKTVGRNLPIDLQDYQEVKKYFGIRD